MKYASAEEQLKRNRQLMAHAQSCRWPPLEERLWTKIDRRGPHECWEWQGKRTCLGYGRIRFGAGNRRKFVHRAVWELTHGPIPEGLCVCHHCDNPPCCNPAHLFLGTQAENTADRHAKGRTARRLGEEVAHAKLTEADVKAIRRFRRAGYTQEAIAAEYGISRANVYKIETRQTWPHVEDE